MRKLRVGILGCGKISEIYLKNLTGMFADRITVVALADVMLESAMKRSEQFNISRFGGPELLLAADDIDLIANLTPAPVHYAMTRSILEAGKHVYSEKPLALSMHEGRELVELAKSKSLRLSVAPDTMLGAGVQQTRQLIDAGEIGRVLAATSLVTMNSVNEHYYSTFRGPLLDVGPYAVAAMLFILGPAKSVSGVVHAKRQPEPNSAVPPMPSHLLTLDNPGNAAVTIEFASGALATLLVSGEASRYFITLKLFGSKGWIEAPDPNTFSGPVKVQIGFDTPSEPTIGFAYADNARGVGIWDIAGAIADGRPHRLSSDFSLHTLEVMLSAIESSKAQKRIELKTTFEPIEPMPAM